MLVVQEWERHDAYPQGAQSNGRNRRVNSNSVHCVQSAIIREEAMRPFQILLHLEETFSLQKCWDLIEIFLMSLILDRGKKWNTAEGSLKFKQDLLPKDFFFFFFFWLLPLKVAAISSHIIFNCITGIQSKQSRGDDNIRHDNIRIQYPENLGHSEWLGWGARNRKVQRNR